MKNTFLFILFLLFLYSCNKKQSQYGDYEIKESYKKCEFTYNNKYISFVLPECYSDVCKPEFFFGRHRHWFDTIITFCSIKNDYNYVEFLIYEDTYDESSLPESVPIWTNVYILSDPPMVPFFEKKTDNNAHVFYLCSAACIDRLPNEADIPNEQQNIVYSDFTYITCFGKINYVYRINNRDPIKDFSYEEKKYIIESVRIEEIKE